MCPTDSLSTVHPKPEGPSHPLSDLTYRRERVQTVPVTAGSPKRVRRGEEKREESGDPPRLCSVPHSTHTGSSLPQGELRYALPKSFLAIKQQTQEHLGDIGSRIPTWVFTSPGVLLPQARSSDIRRHLPFIIAKSVDQRT